MVALNQAYRFHELVREGNYTSRMRIYSIDLNNNPIDVSNELAVEQYGTLLTYGDDDEDSNGRIAQQGIKINDYFNKDENIEIGQSVNCNIEIALINTDGFFATYNWSQTIIIYWDVYDPINEAYLTCPIGVYWWEKPTKVTDIIVKARANNAVWLLETRNAQTFPDESDARWTTGISLYDMYVMFTQNTPGIIVDTQLDGRMPNSDILYHAEPFNGDNLNNREFLTLIAGAAGGTFRARRDGYVTIQFFKDAYWKIGNQTFYYSVDKDNGPTPIKSIDVAEYEVAPIDNVVAMNSKRGNQASAGPGENTLYVVDNGFLNTDQTTMNEMARAIYGSVSPLESYNPISMVCFGDPSVESGDIIRVNIDGTEYKVPIFQQTLIWNGGLWTQEISSFGLEKRPSLGQDVADAYDESETNNQNADRLENVELRTYNLENRFFDSGTITAQSVNANSTYTQNITFGVDFMVVPNVLSSIVADSSSNMGKCSVSVTNVTQTGFTLVIHNGDSAAHTLGASWFAIANMRNSNVVGYGVVGSMIVE